MKNFPNDDICYRCGCRESFSVLRIDGSTTIVKCRSCRLARTKPRPEFDYAKEEKYSGFYLDNEALFRRFARSMIDVIRPFKSSGAFLDIGCAVGYLLDEAKAAGFSRTVGVEFNGEAASVARGKGHEIYPGPVESMEFGGARFDAISLNHVLEHVYDFKPFLAKVRDLLKPDGIVYCGAPNHDSFMRRLLGKSWYGWGMPDHVWHFDSRTFPAVMGEAGFAAKKLVRNSLYYPYSKSLRKNTRATLAAIADRLGLGDQVYGVFRKK
jgi:2-polyprenyl-3-methyl-5-hydroxy-6-metoxy-1,4-benzoquinol methylase